MKSTETPAGEDAGDPPSGQNQGSVVELANRPASDVMARTTSALQQLAALQRKKRQQEPQPQTFEDVVRELMRPMLQDWLERTVPKIVEDVLQPELRVVSLVMV